MQKLNYQVVIDNDQQFVFDNLFNLKYYDQWSQGFTKSTTIRGDFNLNSEIEFLDENGNGIGGFIAENDGSSVIKFVYTHEIANEQNFELVDHQNQYYELYQLTSENGQCILDIELAILDEYASMMDKMWLATLPLIKKCYDK